jgi:uncharacterized membrane protein
MRESTTAKMLALASLIGIILLVEGFFTAPRFFENFLMYSQYSVSSTRLIEDAISSVLGLAGMLSGIALLRRVPWARQLATVVALGNLAAIIIMKVLTPHYASLALILTTLPYFNLLRYCAMYAFLGSLAMRSAWHDLRQPALHAVVAEKVLHLLDFPTTPVESIDRPTTFADKLFRLFPANITPLAGFMAIVLLRWGGNHVLTYIRSSLRPALRPAYHDLIAIYYLVALGLMFAGLTLLCRWRWGYQAALAAVVLGTGMYLSQLYASGLFTSFAQGWGYARIERALFACLTVGMYVAYSIFLLRDRRQALLEGENFA